MSDATALHVLRGATVGALSDSLYTEQELRDMINGLRPVLAPSAQDQEVETLVKELIQQLQIDVDLGTAVTSQDFRPWLGARRAEIEWRRWKAFKQLQLHQGRPPKVIDKLGQLTDEILEYVGDPKESGTWARRGLVIGDVQSGKTGTYLGLFNKAADAGYRLIIVLAGSTESLRQQTQERLDQAFIGRDTRVYAHRGRGAVHQTGNKRFVGIGKVDERVADVASMTTVNADFKQSSLMASNITVTETSPNPYVFVLKKNKSVLTAVEKWLGQQAGPSGRINLPLLLLDDESDYASVNTADEDSPTAINNAIRQILRRFTRSSYVAFTATPFANIFIDHDHEHDLFPRDYVYCLEAPSNYVGASSVFGTSTNIRDDRLMDVSDAELVFPQKHKRDLVVDTLPRSLLEAVRVFFLATAIRDLRGLGGGRAMLVNVSRFKDVQRQVFDLIEDEVTNLRLAIELHGPTYREGQPNSLLRLLEETFEDVFSATEFAWSDVLGALPNAVPDVQVHLVNSDRDKALIDKETLWEKPPRMIAVGGDVLSRGLTLDGLSTSYFYRSAGAFDTLLQMARWFGYRDGYEDLTRIWITEDVADQFRFVDEAVRELRDDLADMKAQRLTPSDFGLAVKKHPDSLLVTARNKMKAATVFTKSVSLGGRRIEMVRIPAGEEQLASNYAAFLKLLTGLEKQSRGSANRQDWPVWRGVSNKAVADFLNDLVVDEKDPLWGGGNLTNFIRMAKSPSMQAWDVVLAQGKQSDAHRRLSIGDVSFVPPQRRVAPSEGSWLRVSGGSARLAGSSDVESITPAERVRLVKAKFSERGGAQKVVPETHFYASLPRPVLIIYPLQAAWANNDAPPAYAHVKDHLLIAAKIAIPGNHTDVNSTATDAEYVINTVAQQGWLSQLELGDDAD